MSPRSILTSDRDKDREKVRAIHSGSYVSWQSQEHSETDRSSPRAASRRHSQADLNEGAKNRASFSDSFTFTSVLDQLAQLHIGEVQELRKENARLLDEYSRLEARFKERWGPSPPLAFGVEGGEKHEEQPDLLDSPPEEAEAAEMLYQDSSLPDNPLDRWFFLVKAYMDVNEDTGDCVVKSESEDSLMPREHWRLHGRPEAEGNDFVRAIRGQRTMMCDEQKTVKKQVLMTIDPTGKRYISWGMMGCALLAWDIIFIPVAVLEIGDLTDLLQVSNMIAMIYWTLDLVLQFFVWVPSRDFKRAIWEVRVAAIAQRYLKTWFFPDVCIISLDYFLLMIDSGNTQARGTLRLTKMMRFMRVARFMRLRKMHEFLGFVTRRQNSEHIVVGIQMSKSVVLLLLMSHYVACVWYALAEYNDSEEPTWISTYGFQSESVFYTYIVSCHWVMTQFSPATNNVAPVNFRERIFALCVVVYALVVFSSFVSGLTNAVNQLRRINMDKTMEESMIQQFLKSRSISPALSSDIKNFFKNSYEVRKKRVTEQDIPFFEEIPKALMVNLHIEVYLPRLTSSVLWIFQPVDDTLLAKVCHYCCEEQAVLSGHEIFERRQKAQSVYCLVSGLATYTVGDTMRRDISSNVNVPTPGPLGEYSLSVRYLRSKSTSSSVGGMPVDIGAWMAEIGLFVDWEHRGVMTTQETCELVKVDVHAVISVSESCSKGTVELIRRFVVMLLALLRVDDPQVPELNDAPLTADILLNAAARAWKFWQMSGAGTPSPYIPCWGQDASGSFCRHILPMELRNHNFRATSQSNLGFDD